MLKRSVRRENLSEPDSVMEELSRQFSGKRAAGETVTMAQAIVLAIGRRALSGEKTAAEYLQRLADEAAEERMREKEINSNENKHLVLRLRMVDPEAGEGADEDTEPEEGLR